MLSVSQLLELLANDRGNQMALRAGVSEEKLQTFETETGYRLPEEVREAYLLHDGQEAWGTTFLGLGRWLPLEWALHYWKQLEKTHREDLQVTTPLGIPTLGWHKTWIPISSDIHENHLCIDVNSQIGNHLGQVIVVWNKSPERLQIARSFECHLLEQLECLGIEIPLAVLFPDHWQDFERAVPHYPRMSL